MRKEWPHLDTEIRSSLSNESKRRSDVNLHNDVPSVIRSCVKHLVESEASCRKGETG